MHMQPQPFIAQLILEAEKQGVSLAKAFARAGLSKSLLSRARRGQRQISFGTAEQVSKAIRELARNARRRERRGNGGAG